MDKTQNSRSIEEALEKINEVRKLYETRRKECSSEDFAVFASDLSLYNAELSEHLAQLGFDADHIEKTAQKNLREKSNQSQGDAAMNARLEALEARRTHDHVRYVYGSTKTFIDSLRTLSSSLRDRNE